MEDAVKHKARVHQLYFIGAFLQAKVKNRVFLKLDSRYVDYFPEYLSYFGRALRLFKSMYGMTNYGKLFSGEFTYLLIEAGFIQYQCQISIYYKYAPYVTKIIVLSYVDDCVYWYTYEFLVKLFVDTLGEIFHLNFLGFSHLFMSISISQISYHYISVYKAGYSTSIVDRYLDTAKVKKVQFP